MKSLSIDKLKTILEDWQNNGIKHIEIDQIERLYEKYGDDFFYDRGLQKMVCTKNGTEYTRLNDLK